jgi:hypothetical protein
MLTWARAFNAMALGESNSRRDALALICLYRRRSGHHALLVMDRMASARAQSRHRFARPCQTVGLVGEARIGAQLNLAAESMMEAQIVGSLGHQRIKRGNAGRPKNSAVGEGVKSCPTVRPRESGDVANSVVLRRGTWCPIHPMRFRM